MWVLNCLNHVHFHICNSLSIELYVLCYAYSSSKLHCCLYDVASTLLHKILSSSDGSKVNMQMKYNHCTYREEDDVGMYILCNMSSTIVLMC